MKVLVVGSGAREHALVRSLAADPLVEAIVAAPGNPGIGLIARCEAIPGGVTDADALVALARDLTIDLVVIGLLISVPIDVLRAAGFAVYGPSGDAAALEGSKSFAKEIMSAAGVPTALAHVCTTVDEVTEALDALGAPHVVKDDGLAAGKGVVVTDDHEEALAHARACLAKPEGRVVIEEFLDGPEVSLFCVCDGEVVVPLAPAQDFKRIFDGGRGPNTGGMGAYSPLPWAPADLVERVVAQVARPTIEEMARRGTPFVGTLFIGLALTARGPKVIEFNARFGDPETQVVLARLLSPLGQLLNAAARGQLDQAPALRWSPDAAVTVVVAAQSYPATPRTGDPITLDPGLEELPTAYVLHAGTAFDDDGTLVTAGGRVLSVTATGSSLDEARVGAYAAADLVAFDGAQRRGDIAKRAARGDVVVPTA